MFRKQQLMSAVPRKELQINEPIKLKELEDLPDPVVFTTEELKKLIWFEKRRGGDPRPFEISYYTKYALPAGCILFALVSPLSKRTVHRCFA
jgi:hypothetical protein